MSIDVLRAAEPWMQVCGPHDYGVDSAPCGCPPDGDPRVIVSKLAAEVETLRKRLAAAHDALTRVEDDDPDEFVTLESTVEWVVASYRRLVAENEQMDRMLHGAPGGAA